MRKVKAINSKTRLQEKIIDDLVKCNKDECHDCKAYLVSWNGNQGVCLALILQEYNKQLKADIEKLLEKY